MCGVRHFTFNDLERILLSAKYYQRNGLTEDEGISLMIHNKTIPPNIESNTIKLRPETSTDVIVTVKSMERQQAPYSSQCQNSYPDSLTNVEDAFMYSQTYCRSVCKSEYIFQKCGCYHPYFIPPKVNSRNATKPQGSKLEKIR